MDNRSSIGGRLVVLNRFLVLGRGLVRGSCRSISLARNALNTALKITSADILIEDCAISTLESVLLTILMAEVVNLNEIKSEMSPTSTSSVISPHNLPLHRHSVARGRACCGSQSLYKSLIRLWGGTQ